jgi:hypothetical protein
MNNLEEHNDKPYGFKDIKKQSVEIGDFVMYPILTYLRCGVVHKVYGDVALSVRYIRPYYAPHDVENDFDAERFISLGRQTVSLHARSVVKISEFELMQILPKHEFLYLTELRNKIVKK